MKILNKHDYDYLFCFRSKVINLVPSIENSENLIFLIEKSENLVPLIEK